MHGEPDAGTPARPIREEVRGNPRPQGRKAPRAHSTVLIEDDPADSDLQRATFWIDRDDDDVFDESEKKLQDNKIDNTWSGGRFGFFRQKSSSAYTQKYDNLTINADADGDNNYDDKAVELDFDSAAISLTHDYNGNPTFDGLYNYT